MLLEGRAGSIGELVDEAVRLSAEFRPRHRESEDVWFRGQRHANEPLLPNLYKEGNRRFNYDERTLMSRFQSLASPMVERVPANDWEWYFLARHHGLPSRLIDWTESLLTALFFALHSHIPADRLKRDDVAEREPADSLYDEESPTIWLLECGSLNARAVRADAILAASGPIAGRYLPLALEHPSPKNALPIAVLPARANDRIVAQQGMFTIHGHEEVPIEALAQKYPSVRLGKIVLDRARSARFSRDLEVLGVHHLTMFPDLDAAVSRSCWICQSAY